MIECSRSADGRHSWNEFRRADVIDGNTTVAGSFGIVRFRISCRECGVVTHGRAIAGTRTLEVRVVTTDQFFRKARGRR